MKHKVSVSINGKQREDEVEPRLLLVHYLRDVAGLRGIAQRPGHLDGPARQERQG